MYDGTAGLDLVSTPMDFTRLLPGDIVVLDNVVRRSRQGDVVFELKQLCLVAHKPLVL